MTPKLLCWFGWHKWGVPVALETLGIWYHQCKRCGRMKKTRSGIA